MLFLVYWLVSIVIAHLLMFVVTRKIGPPPEKEKGLIVFFMVFPFINNILSIIAIIILLIGYDNAPLLKFYNFIFNSK